MSIDFGKTALVHMIVLRGVSGMLCTKYVEGQKGYKRISPGRKKNRNRKTGTLLRKGMSAETDFLGLSL